MVITLIIIFFLIVIGFMGYGMWNLVKQNEDLEETVVYYQEKLDEIREVVLDTDTRLKDLDIRGAFEADDEVGFVFKEIKELSSDLTKTVESAYEFRT
jgi:cell division protein FtsB